jgi:hypothetical protein
MTADGPAHRGIARQTLGVVHVLTAAKHGVTGLGFLQGILRVHFRFICPIAEIPGPRFFAGGNLQISPGHVEAARVAKYDALHVARDDAKSFSADSDDQFHFVMIVFCFRRIGNGCARQDDSARRFGKIPRRLAIDFEAHFLCVISVVSTDAKNPINGIPARANESALAVFFVIVRAPRNSQDALASEHREYGPRMQASCRMPYVRLQQRQVLRTYLSDPIRVSAR